MIIKKLIKLIRIESLIKYNKILKLIVKSSNNQIIKFNRYSKIKERSNKIKWNREIEFKEDH